MKDLSSMPENQDFPAYYSSMMANNTVTEKNPHFAGRGSDSEATHDIIAGSVNWIGEAHPTPVLPGPETPDNELNTDEKGTSYAPAPRAWKDLG